MKLGRLTAAGQELVSRVIRGKRLDGGHQLVPLCNSRDQFLSRKETAISAVKKRSVSQKRYERKPPSWHQHFLALAHPGATLTRRCVRQMGKHSARAGRRAQCPRSHIGVIGITIRCGDDAHGPGQTHCAVRAFQGGHPDEPHAGRGNHRRFCPQLLRA